MKILLCLVMSLALLVNAESQWKDMYAFPFLATPLQIMMGISCPSQNGCYITGGNTNTAFGIYKTGPVPTNFSNVTKLEIKSPEPAIFLLSVAMQDDNDGVCGGVEIGLGGTYYTKDGNVFQESAELGVMTTQAIYSLGNETYAFVGQLNKGQGPAISTDGGQEFIKHFWAKGFSADAPPRYGAFPSNDTWYISGGTWPQENQTNSEDYIEISQRVRFNKVLKSYEFRYTSSAIPNDDNHASSKSLDGGLYTAVIAKTTDGGKTWTSQYHSTGKFYFNQISCASEETCMAVAEGMAADGGDPGCHIFGTTNGGANWTQIYTYGVSKGGTCLALEMLSETEAWVGTTYAVSQLKSGCEFSHTVDGGKTWTQEKKLAEVSTITEMSFIDNDHAYAIAITSVQLSTALEYAPVTEIAIEEEYRFLDH